MFDRFSNRAMYYGALAGAIALLAVSAHRALGDLFVQWQTEEYSHSPLIPFLAVLIGWHKLAERKPTLTPSWLGIGVLALAGALQAISALSAFVMIAHYALWLGFVGVCLAFTGRKATWALAPALVYLVFTIPLPRLVQANLSQDMQLLSSVLGVMPLGWLGIPVFREGNVIDLGAYQLQVVEACSGLRYLFPLMSFGYLVALLVNDRLWKKLVVFLSAIPITIAMNALRIAVIGVTVDLWGPKMAEGLTHDLEGWTVFIMCTALLMGETWLLLKIPPRGHFRYEYLGLAKGPLFQRDERRSWGPALAALALCALLAGVAVVSPLDDRQEIVPARLTFAAFPTRIGSWQGRQQAMDDKVLDELKLTDYWMADYARPADPTTINFYLAYYASQRTGAMTHSPGHCIPGGGWNVASKTTMTINDNKGRPINLTRLVIRKKDQASLVYYWFDERGRTFSETSVAKWYLLVDSLAMRRTDGALVRLVAPVVSGQTEAETEAKLKDFIAQMPNLAPYIPGRGG